MDLNVRLCKRLASLGGKHCPTLYESFPRVARKTIVLLRFNLAAYIKELRAGRIHHRLSPAQLVDFIVGSASFRFEIRVWIVPVIAPQSEGNCRERLQARPKTEHNVCTTRCRIVLRYFLEEPWANRYAVATVISAMAVEAIRTTLIVNDERTLMSINTGTRMTETLYPMSQKKSSAMCFTITRILTSHKQHMLSVRRVRLRDHLCHRG